jgi:cystathionine beta-lyase family protein involved in aluminum resistance
LPGYQDKVIMAGGTFIQGSSIELTADAPMRPPYIVYLQGGLSYAHAIIGILQGVQELKNKGLLTC